jgi:Zn-finger nucleic acid-binding protein
MCPACKSPMVSLEFEGVEIDRCLECGGTWLDAGELELLVELAGIDTTALSRGLREAATLRTGSRRCPRCRRRMRVIEVGGANKVELDRCPRGDGLWLDRGEMETVVRSFSEGEEGAVAKFLGELYRSELRVPSEGN